VRTVITVLGMLLFVSCSVLILAGWRKPSSRFLVGFVQTRNVKSGDPARRAAAACWLILGFAAGSVGLLASVDPDEPLRDTSLHNLLGYVSAVAFVAGLAVAVWVRWGDAPQSLRPAAMRDPV
jgi:protein-S-isoprenylcysteine O-methyltransferase Ste14